MMGWIDLCGIKIACHCFVYLWESELRGFVHHWGCDHWGHASLELQIHLDSVTLRLHILEFCALELG